jgi:hypothetical protein
MPENTAMVAVLNLICQGGNWRWVVLLDRPKVTIKGEKSDYKSRGAARRAAVNAVAFFGLRIDRVLFDNVASS